MAKSVAQHKLDGTYQKCRHADRGTNLEPVESVKCPKSLGSVKDEWDTVVGALCRSKLVTVADIPLLEEAFANLKLAREAQELVDKYGGAALYLSGLASNQTNLVREIQNARKIYRDVMLKFGVTPVNAQKVRGIKQPDAPEDDAVLRIIGNG